LPGVNCRGPPEENATAVSIARAVGAGKVMGTHQMKTIWKIPKLYSPE
jgi:hypothetical protein